MRQFRECHGDMIMGHVISHHRRIKVDITAVDRGGTGFVLFKDFLEWLEGIHPKYALLDNRNAFFNPSSSQASLVASRGREDMNSSALGFSSGDEEQDKNSSKYRAWLRKKQLKVLERSQIDNSHDDDGDDDDGGQRKKRSGKRDVSDVVYSSTESGESSMDSDDMFLLNTLEFPEDDEHRSFFWKSTKLSAAEARLKEKYRRAKYRQKVKRKTRREEERKRIRKRHDQLRAAGQEPASDTPMTTDSSEDGSDFSDLSDFGRGKDRPGNPGFFSRRRAEQERRENPCGG